MCTKNNKIICDYLGYKYIPHNNLQGFPKAGVWEVTTSKVLLKKGGRITKGEEFVRFKARTYKDLYLGIPALLKVVEKLENEDLRRYGYKWTFGDEQYFNNLGLRFLIWDREVEFEMSFELDPSKTISRKEFKNYGEDFRNKLKEVVVETIEYINKIKIESIK